MSILDPITNRLGAPNHATIHRTTPPRFQPFEHPPRDAPRLETGAANIKLAAQVLLRKSNAHYAQICDWNEETEPRFALPEHMERTSLDMKRAAEVLDKMAVDHSQAQAEFNTDTLMILSDGLSLETYKRRGARANEADQISDVADEVATVAEKAGEVAKNELVDDDPPAVHLNPAQADGEEGTEKVEESDEASNAEEPRENELEPEETKKAMDELVQRKWAHSDRLFRSKIEIPDEVHDDLQKYHPEEEEEEEDGAQEEEVPEDQPKKDQGEEEAAKEKEEGDQEVLEEELPDLTQRLLDELEGEILQLHSSEQEEATQRLLDVLSSAQEEETQEEEAKDDLSMVERELQGLAVWTKKNNTARNNRRKRARVLKVTVLESSLKHFLPIG